MLATTDRQSHVVASGRRLRRGRASRGPGGRGVIPGGFDPFTLAEIWIMFIGKVTGSVVASQKIENVVGFKLLLVQAMSVKCDAPGEVVPTSRVAIVMDTLGAGEGELVIVTQGSSARLTPETKTVPTDAVVVGIIDAIQLGHEQIYDKQ